MITTLMIMYVVLIKMGLSDTSVPVGQNPSIVYDPKQNGNTFLIYNSAQGLQSMYCEDSRCDKNIPQTLKCDAKLYASALLAIPMDENGHGPCNKTITTSSSSSHNNGDNAGQETKTVYCTYYMVIGYGSLTSSKSSGTSSVSFIICYDSFCSLDTMDEIVIDTAFNDEPYSFGYSISLTRWVELSSGKRYPMFTYSKYSTILNKYILNVIICLNVICSKWIGKNYESFASNPPYVILGPDTQSISSSVGKGIISIQETWEQAVTNWVTIMFSKLVNITNKTAGVSKINVFVLVTATCSLNTGKYGLECNSFIGKELNSTIVFGKDDITIRAKQILKTNFVSMKQYEPASTTTGVPLFITTYIIDDNTANNKATPTNELWLLYCFDIFCTKSSNRTFYSVRNVKLIDYPQLALPTTSDQASDMPHIIYFENSTSLAVMTCDYKEYTPWNCTNLDYNLVTLAIYNETNFESASMQISVVINPLYSYESVILFSQVMNKDGSGAGIFNGTIYIQCGNTYCQNYNGGVLIQGSNSINTDKFQTNFDIQVFVILSWILTFITIFGIFSIYKFISPSNFISKNVRNAYLTKVSLDSSIRSLSYWFFFANLICSAMCIIPWFAYFDYDYKLYSLMIVPPFIPIILTLFLVLILHICPLQTKNKCFINFLIIISFLYYLSTILLSYSFSYVWNLKSKNCQTSDLSGLKIVILTGHIATCIVIQYLLFWNIKCFQALKIASPESRNNKLVNNNNNIHHDLDVNINNNNNNTHHKIIPNSRLLAALNDRQ